LAQLAMVSSARGQSQAAPADNISLADAARLDRARLADSAKHARIITNEDLPKSRPSQFRADYDLTFPTPLADAAANVVPVQCESPDAVRVRTDLQAAQQELEQLGRELSYQPEVISDSDLDASQFRKGYSGLDVGSPPLLDNEAPIAARVTQVEVQERIDVLQKVLRITCQPTDSARIQAEIDQAQEQLDLLQRQFALDQEDYSSRPVTETLDPNTRLDTERQEVQDLKSQIEQLQQQLATLPTAERVI
jgi:cob(I)alamin adenosyltransferase